ncbi:MAG: 23S rRNA (guanosine(2251)-2'-O)-methyltransferase RlmB [Thermaerobacterales bacterium]
MKGSRQRRPPPDQELITGRQPVQEAVRAALPLLWLEVARGTKGDVIQEIVAAATERDIPVKWVDRSAIDRRAGGTNHQGVIAGMAEFPYSDMDALLALAADRGEPPFILIAAEVLDPQNLGSLIRTAEGAGMHGVIIPRHRSAGVTAAVLRVSAGAAAHLPVARVTNLRRTLDELKLHGLWFAAADGSGSQTIYEADLAGPLGIVVGSEGRGIPRLVNEHCDFHLRIPMLGSVDSLNAGVAGALMIYEALRQRLAGRGANNRAIRQ